MTELPGPLQSPQAYREAFAQGLSEMLEAHANMGVFILVLANAYYEPGLKPRLQGALLERFDLLAEQVRQRLGSGSPLREAPDDLLVFLKLMALGLEQLQPTRFRRVGNFGLQFNPLRAFRPARSSEMRVTELQRPFDAQAFHFNKPFLRKEILWEGELFGQTARLMYNKYPFAPLHALLVLQPELEKPQFLTEQDHHLVWQLGLKLAENLPGVGFGYNSYGAYASINHQHFQMFVRSSGQYSIQSLDWQHNGGDRAYPLACECFVDAQAAWGRLTQLHRQTSAYNLLYLPGCLYVLPRRLQGSYQHSAWTGGFAWSELAGEVTVFNREAFDDLDEQTIVAEMAAMQPG